MRALAVDVQRADGGSAARTVEIAEVLLAGYTGRDRAGVLAHIRELEEVGVAPPPRIPMVYVVAPELVTTESQLSVPHAETSGEVEFFVVPAAEGLLVGVGSDHTDRKHEAIDVAESKRRCPKVISSRVWHYADLQDHWDALHIRAWVTIGGERRLYQDGTLKAFMAVDDLLAELRSAGHAELDRRLIFGGTLAALSGFVYGDRFECLLHDPVLDRSLRCAYDIVVQSV